MSVTPIQSAFVTRLRECLDREARDQKTIAELAGLAPETITRWKKGQQDPNPTLTELEALAGALGVDAIDLIAETPEVAALRQENAQLRTAANDRGSQNLEMVAFVREIGQRAQRLSSDWDKVVSYNRSAGRPI